MSVGTVGFSFGSLFLGGGFSESGRMLLRAIDEWNDRTGATGVAAGRYTAGAMEALAMMQLAGVGARRGTRRARRKPALPTRERDFILRRWREGGDNRRRQWQVVLGVKEVTTGGSLSICFYLRGARATAPLDPRIHRSRTAITK